MRLRSFTTVIIRIIGMMSIIYGLMTALFILITFSMFSNFPGGMGSMIWLQLLVPILMCLLGVVLLAASRNLAGAISGGLED